MQFRNIFKIKLSAHNLSYSGCSDRILRYYSVLLKIIYLSNIFGKKYIFLVILLILEKNFCVLRISNKNNNPIKKICGHCF